MINNVMTEEKTGLGFFSPNIFMTIKLAKPSRRPQS